MPGIVLLLLALTDNIAGHKIAISLVLAASSLRVG